MPVFKILNFDFATKLGIWQLTETAQDLEALIFSSLADTEKAEYANFRSEGRRKEWLAVRILVQKLKSTASYNLITYDAACKPHLADGFISISHTRDFVAVLISSVRNVAVDIEKIAGRAKRISDKFLSQAEKMMINPNSDFDTTLLWSVKETAYKFYGKKELPFIGGIKILDIAETKVSIKILSQRILTVGYSKFADHILTYIV